MPIEVTVSITVSMMRNGLIVLRLGQYRALITSRGDTRGKQGELIRETYGRTIDIVKTRL